MAKVFMISNTQFGYKNHLGVSELFSENQKFFNDEFIPFLKKYSQNDDYVVHFGNVFKSGQSLNIKILNSVLKIVEDISSIIPMYFLISQHDKIGNDTTLNVFKYIKNVHIIHKNTTIDNVSLSSTVGDINTSDILLTSCNPSLFNILDDSIKVYTNYNSDSERHNIVKTPYPIEKDDSNCGFVILDTVKKIHKFIPNRINDKYKKLVVNSINDITNISSDYFENNFVELIVDEDLYNNVEFKIKLSELNVFNVDIKSSNDSNILDNTIVDNIFNIDELITKEIESNTEILNEFRNIKKIYDDNLDE